MDAIISNLKNKTNNEIKYDQSKQKMQEEVIERVEEFLMNVIQKPTLWMRPELKLIRSYMNVISSDKETFPPPSKSVRIGTINLTPDPVDILSENFVHGVYNRML